VQECNPQRSIIVSFVDFTIADVLRSASQMG